MYTMYGTPDTETATYGLGEEVPLILQGAAKREPALGGGAIAVPARQALSLPMLALLFIGGYFLLAGKGSRRRLF